MTELVEESDIRLALDILLPSTGDAAHWKSTDHLQAGRSYLSALATGGWFVSTWPRQFGGRDATDAEATLIDQVRAGYPAPDLYAFGIGLSIIGPMLLGHASTLQQDRWLHNIATGGEVWCQMFSEPDAGSDLANISTAALGDGDVWRLKGQKVWTSRGPYADWGLVLTRTDPELPKHRGLTMFAIKMDQPGITVRPVVQMDGDSHFSEIFLDSCEIPDVQRIGDVNDGWRIALAVLAFERAGIGRRTGGIKTLQMPAWLLRLARAGRLDDAVLRNEAARTYVLEITSRLTALRASAASQRGNPGPEGSGGKLRVVAITKAVANLRKNAAGAAGMLAHHDGAQEFLTPLPSPSAVALTRYRRTLLPSTS